MAGIRTLVPELTKVAIAVAEGAGRTSETDTLVALAARMERALDGFEVASKPADPLQVPADAPSDVASSAPGCPGEWGTATVRIDADGWHPSKVDVYRCRLPEGHDGDHGEGNYRWPTGGPVREVPDEKWKPTS